LCFEGYIKEFSAIGCIEFEQRVGLMKDPCGAKIILVRDVIAKMQDGFTVKDI